MAGDEDIWVGLHYLAVGLRREVTISGTGEHIWVAALRHGGEELSAGWCHVATSFKSRGEDIWVGCKYLAGSFRKGVEDI